MKKNRILYYAIALFCVIVLVYVLSVKLVEGARWSSGFPLASADNYLYGNGNLYTVEEEGMTPGSSYFPALMFLGIIFRQFFSFGAESAFICFGLVVMVLTVLGFAIMATEGKKERFILSVIALVLFVLEFPSARSYLLEVHPDIPALMCFLWAVICIDKYLHSNNKWFLVSSLFLFILSGLFKQNAAFLFIGLGVYILFSTQIDIKNKVSIILCEVIAGVTVIAVVLSIDGCWKNCVTINSLHHHLPIKEYLSYGAATIRFNIVFLAFFVIYLYRRLFTGAKEKRMIVNMWLAASIFWFAFGMYGSAKDGANGGNMEASIITFMPFVLIVAKGFYYRIVELMSKGRIRLYVRYINSIIILFLLLLDSFIIVGICKNFEKYVTRITEQKMFSEWLTANYNGCAVAYNTCFYEVLNDAQVKKKTELHTTYVWNMAGLINDDELLKIEEKEKWDVIITHHYHGEVEWPKTFASFKKLDSSEYPATNPKWAQGLEVYIKR